MSVNKAGFKKFKNGKNKANVECYSCHKKGHYAWECPQKKNKKKWVDSSKNCAFVLTNASDKSSKFNSMSSIGMILKMSTGDVWLTDSGSSRHISYRRDWFSEFTPSVGEQVVLGDDGSCDVLGTRTIQIKKN